MDPQKNKIKDLVSKLELAKQDEEVSLAYLRRKINSCKRCKLADIRLQPIDGEFPPKAKPILFVVDAPKLQDDATGKLMVGIHGEQFSNLVKSELGLKRGEYNISSVVKCLCLGHNLDPTNKKRVPVNSIFWCLEYLFEQIKIIKPKIIIGLGFTPFFVFLYRSDERFALKEMVPLEQFSGKLYRTKAILTGEEYPYFQTYDPSVWLKSTRIRNIVIKDFEKIRKILDDIYAKRCIENLYEEFVDPVWELRRKRASSKVSKKKRVSKGNN